MILLILTGGTIGSALNTDKTIDVNGSSLLLDMYKKLDKDTGFEIMRPLDILSENMTQAHWEKLANAIYGADTNKYDGIIIAHGSDTLAYTSALIAMLFARTEIPICLIAADYPLEDKRSNGMDNMRAAVCLIKDGINGVFTVYADEHGADRVKIYPAARVLEADTYNDRFSCYGGEVFGYICNEKFYPNKKLPLLGSRFGKKISVNGFKNKVMLIRPYPSIDYSLIDISGVKAVVHYSYHAGTACAKALAEFADRCQKAGTDIYLGSLKSPDAAHYASTETLLKSALIPVFNISAHALYIKALIAYNQSEYDPEIIMQSNMADEVLPQK